MNEQKPGKRIVSWGRYATMKGLAGLLSGGGIVCGICIVLLILRCFIKFQNRNDTNIDYLRYFPHHELRSLPLFPILLDDIRHGGSGVIEPIW